MDFLEDISLVDTKGTDISALRLPYKYTPRPYQLPPWQAMFPRHFGLNHAPKRRLDLCWHRRSGKDKTAINMVTMAASEEVGNYLYLLPEQTQAKKVIWRGVGGDKIKFIDHIPPQLIKKKYNSEMLVELTTGSTIQLGGADNYDSWMGTNPIGILLSEYSIQDPAAWNYLRPILVENGGWAIFVYTPRGHNHGHQLHTAAQKDPRVWYSSKLTVDDTWYYDPETGNPRRVVTEEMIAQEIKDGMPANMVQQEFYCSFDAGLVGAYYADLILALIQASPTRIGVYPHDPRLPVVTAWDLGINDTTAIWFVQPYQGGLRIIDYHEENNLALTDHIKIVKEKPYNYLEHYAPHDITVRDYGTGKARLETAQEHGIDFIVAPKLPRQDGIDAVRALLPRCYFHNSPDTERGVDALKSYQKVYDERLKQFRDQPLHNWASNGADAFRTLAVCWQDDNFHQRRRPVRVKRSIGGRRR